MYVYIDIVQRTCRLPGMLHVWSMSGEQLLSAAGLPLESALTLCLCYQFLRVRSQNTENIFRIKGQLSCDKVGLGSV